MVHSKSIHFYTDFSNVRAFRLKTLTENILSILGVDFINCLVPYAKLLCLAPNFCASKKLLNPGLYLLFSNFQVEALVHDILTQTNDSSRDAQITTLIDQMTSRFVTDVDLKERMEIWRQKLGKEFEQEVQVMVAEKVQVIFSLKFQYGDLIFSI